MGEGGIRYGLCRLFAERLDDLESLFAKIPLKAQMISSLNEEEGLLS
jgi:hypothetical protein